MELAFLAAVSSCGGPYTGSKAALPEQKLAIAADLFDRGKYADAAVEYKSFLASFAGDERSDYAQFRLAESYRLDEEYALAAVEYRILINDYGYSEYVDDAFFLEALCAFRQAPRAERDQSKSYEALDRVNRFLQLFPSSQRIEEAKSLKLEIHDRLGKKDFLGGKLYFSKELYDAALIYLDKVITNYPSTVWAARSHYYKGLILDKRGDQEGAAGEFRASLSSGSDFREKEDAARRMRELAGGESGEG
jgi:outer membrane protein assembly factor BamD